MDPWADPPWGGRITLTRNPNRPRPLVLALVIGASDHPPPPPPWDPRRALAIILYNMALWLLLLCLLAYALTPALTAPAEVSCLTTAIGAAHVAPSVKQTTSSHAFEPVVARAAPHVDTVQRNVVKVNTTRLRQKIIGFGGAFTESAGRQFAKLDENDKQTLLQLYFGASEESEDGHNYVLGRIAINACDFSGGNYAFDDVDGDEQLVHFDTNVTQDQEFVIPFVRAAQAFLANRGVELRLIASPWSPPAWMKAPNPEKNNTREMTGSADPVGLDTRYSAAWARYVSRWVTAYKALGIPMWAMTVQNEPEFAAPWEANMMTPDFQASFVRDHLGPTMRADHPDLLILAYDHNKDHMVTWADAMFNETSGAKPFVDGIAVHWYTGDYFDHVETTYRKYGDDKLLIASEACNCPGVSHGMQSWFRAEDIAHDVLGDLDHGISAWLDWNLMLNPNGGPNHLGNMCDANVIVDVDHVIPEAHVFARRGNALVLQPSYFFFGHFSRHATGKRAAEVVVDLHLGERAREASEVQNGEKVAMFKCDGGSRERWVYDEVKQNLGLMHTNMCMDVQDEVANGASIQVWECVEGNTHQKFVIESRTTSQSTVPNEVRLRVDGTTKCLDVVDNTMRHGAMLQLWECHEGPNQGFTIEMNAIRSAVDRATSWCVTAGAKAIFDAAAFVDESSGEVAVITLNRGDEPVVFDLLDVTSGRQATQVVGLPHGIQTWLYRPQGVKPPSPPQRTPVFGGGDGNGAIVRPRGGSVALGIIILVGGGMSSLLICGYALRHKPVGGAAYANLPLD